MPLHGLGVRRHSRHRPGLPMRQSWCSDGQYPCPDCLWPSTALCPGCWPWARTQARPHSAQRTRQPSNTVTVSTAGRLQPDIGAGYHHSRLETLSYTCPQVTLTLSPVPSIFPAADNKWSYWVCPYSDCYATTPPSPSPPPRTPTTPTLLPPVAMQLSKLLLEYAQHTQPGVAKWLSHPPLEYTHHALPPLCQLWLPHLSLKNAHHARPSTSCGYVASHQSLEYAHHAQPGVAMWLSHPSLEYAHHAHLSASCGYVAISFIPGVRTPRPARCGYVAISPIPGVRPPRPPLCQLWLRGYLVYPWSTHTTPSQVWLCGYLTHPWSTPTTPTSLPAVATWLSRLSLEYAHHAQPGVAMWLSHPSLEYAHHAHLSASCGYVAISPIPGIRPPRPPLCLCQLWLRDYLTYPWSTPTTPTFLPAVATWLSHPSLEYAHHAHLSASASCGYVTISLIPGVRTQPPARCGYLTHPWSTPTSLPLPAVAISLIPGSCPPCPPFCQLWLCGFSSIPVVRTPRPASCAYLTYPWSTPTTPTLCQLWLRGYLTYPWSIPNTSALLTAVAMRLCHQTLEYAQST